MSDFDDRLSAVLTAEADDAPHGAGLAQAARHRHVVRRRRRIAGAGVATAAVVALPVAVLGLGGDGGVDDMVGADTSTAPGDEWQWAVRVDARAEIPGDWNKYTCDFDGFESEIYGPDEHAACSFESYVAFYASATFDPLHRPGVITTATDGAGGSWGGYVYAGEYAVSSATPDRELTRRILASARIDGQQEIDGSEWRTLDGLDLRVDVPLWWGLGPDAEVDNYSVCAVLGDRNDPPEAASQPGTRSTWISFDYRDGRWISVSAPTPAVADLVLASVETRPGSVAVGCVPEDFAPSPDETTTQAADEWQPFEADGVRFELPAHWERLVPGDCPSADVYGPGTASCESGEYLTLYAKALFDMAMPPGKITSAEEDGETLWSGYVFAGDWAVFVRTYERRLTEDILATVR